MFHSVVMRRIELEKPAVLTETTTTSVADKNNASRART
jgi:hypothetical protein